ncbi:MAG TPA: fused MFS/spermidine synthase, partial [Ktedonobacterales bacterium]
MTTDPLTETSAVAGASATPASAASKRAQRESGLMNLVRTGHLPLLILVFVAGIVSLGIEVSGGRLMAPYFGTTDLIWAMQIGSTLIYLSIGYWFGGRLADRYPSERVLCAITAVAGVATGLLAFVSGPVLRLALPLLDGLNLGSSLDNGSSGVVLFGVSLLMAVLLFSIPVTLLGMVSPFAIRITVASVGSAGTRAGSLYALSTVGSILGAFLPVLWLIPWIGVRRTLLALAVALILASLWGLVSHWRWLNAASVALMLVFLLLPSVASLGPLKPTPPNLHYLYDEETPYNYIQVVKDANGTNFLLMNEGAGAEHSWYNPNYILSPGHYWYSDYMLTAPYFNASPDAWKVRKVAIVGLAGGTMARQFDAVF